MRRVALSVGYTDLLRTPNCVCLFSMFLFSDTIFAQKILDQRARSWLWLRLAFSTTTLIPYNDSWYFVICHPFHNCYSAFFIYAFL